MGKSRASESGLAGHFTRVGRSTSASSQSAERAAVSVNRLTPDQPCPMPRRSRSVQLTLSLPAKDYRIYESAAKLLRNSMRDQAPNVMMLIQSKLIRHDPAGIAEDYLDLIDWPHAERNLIQSVERPPRRKLLALPANRRRPSDPSRN